MAFGKYYSEIISLVKAGLPQGSHLSPLSYIFYNADLIEIPIPKTEGGLGFIDDFSALVVGKSVSENLERIENEVITRVVQWAQASGATFKKTKTELIHFTRNLNINPQPYQAIRFEDSYIAPQDSLKPLKVILDKQLRMKEHVGNAASKAISRCLAIKRLCDIKPKAIQQLYNTAVTSISHYTASTWYKPKTSYPLFDQVQRLGGQAITKAFCFALLPILEAEARIYLVEIRLRLPVLKHIVNLHTTPHSHLFWKCRYRAAKQQKRFLSPLAHFLQEFEPELDKKH